MIHDLVLHLLKYIYPCHSYFYPSILITIIRRQGCYNNQKNIVILSAYLGQIPKIRKKLQNVVTTVVDERDATLLDQLGLDDDDATPVQQIHASNRVLIRSVSTHIEAVMSPAKYRHRTLDNFQGEEGEIIILSLVRNNGTSFDGSAASLEYSPGTRSHIGFLRVGMEIRRKRTDTIYLP